MSGRAESRYVKLSGVEVCQVERSRGMSGRAESRYVRSSGVETSSLYKNCLIAIDSVIRLVLLTMRRFVLFKLRTKNS